MATFVRISDYKEECIGHTQKVLFYIPLPSIAVEMAGHVVSLAPFLDLQTRSENEERKKEKEKNENEKKNEERKKEKNENEIENEKAKEKKSGEENEEGNKIFVQIPGLIMVMIVVMAGGIGLPYIKPWSLRFGIPAISAVVATLLFFIGWVNYERKDPDGSPLTTTVRVFVVTARNISKPTPDPKDLNNDDDTHTTSTLSLIGSLTRLLLSYKRTNNRTNGRFATCGK